MMEILVILIYKQQYLINRNDFKFNIYLNNGNDFNLKISNNIEKILITVYDLFGKEIFAKQIVTNTNSRSVYTIYSSQKLNAGIYLITVDVDK